MLKGSRPNRVISKRFLHLIMDHLGGIILNNTTSSVDMYCMVMVGSYLLINFSSCLQGNEGLLVELKNLTTNINHGKEVG